MDPQQFEERMEEALKAPFPKEYWPTTDFRMRLGNALEFASPHSLGIKADVYNHLVRFANADSDDLNLTEAAAALNCIEAATPYQFGRSLKLASETYQQTATAAEAWNEIVEPIKKKAFAEIAAQAKLQQNAPKGKQVKLVGGKKK